MGMPSNGMKSYTEAKNKHQRLFSVKKPDFSFSTCVLYCTLMSTRGWCLREQTWE